MGPREHALWVKICGICDETALLAAQNAGADAVGFVFADSPRRVEPERARRLTGLLRRPMARVGVFVDATVDEILGVVRHVGLTHAQLHGDEPDDHVLRLRAAGVRVIRAFRIGAAADAARAEAADADLLLLDARDPVRAGGTGRVFDWDLALDPARSRRVVLAGGLTPYNVGDAVRRVRPFGVDVSSGVERAPGVKDPSRVASFVNLARSAWQAAVLREAAEHRRVMDRVRRAT